MDPLTPDDPEHIGPYRLLGRLGAGGMGRVYLARSQGGRTVAVKLVQREYAAEPEFRRRFAQEVAAARRVGGEWTAPVLDADTDAEVPWVATGYVPGPPLNAVVDAHGSLPESSVRVLAHRLARALEAIHTAGLIHRDLKPSNVLLTVDGPRVIDFGIARALDTVVDAVRTRTGAVVGSPGFMSPEQVRAQRLTAASDVFCLGSVLAFAATGRPPFGAATSGVHALLYRVAYDEPDLTGLPAGLADVVRDCLHKDPTARPTPADVARRTGSAASEAEPWLPGAVLAELGRHAAQLLDTDSLPVVSPSASPAEPQEPAAAAASTAWPSALPPPPSSYTLESPADAVPPGPREPDADRFTDTPALGLRVPQPHTGTLPLAPQGPHTPQPSTASPAPGPSAAPMTTAVSPPTHGAGEPLAPAAQRHRVRAALLGAGGVVVAAVLALVVANLPGDGDRGDTGTQGGSGSPVTSPSATGAPPELLGTWEGQVNSTGQRSIRYVRLVLPDDGTGPSSSRSPAKVSDEDRDGTDAGTGTGTDAGAGSGTAQLLLGTVDELCEAKAGLRERTDRRAVLDSGEVTRTHPADAPDAPCSLPDHQTVTVTKDGLHWVSGDMSADLTRANTGKRVVPTSYLGTWRPAPPGASTAYPHATHDPNGADGATVTVSQGPVGAPVVHTTGTVHGRHCAWTESLISIRDGILVMGPYEVDPDKSDAGCPSGMSHIYLPGENGGLDIGDANSLTEPRSHLERVD
ncbi:serine/threonine-protein kinase [Streptomyces odontomachi]|uniref:serine/threonine-protein kinase n=1 Tax=Streptomyces odontomachi TaxID=2944940 RepID=UPI00210D9AE7|nr:serine/threonine-protein kinase [Streptomyces sp. ODS25]